MLLLIYIYMIMYLYRCIKINFEIWILIGRVVIFKIWVFIFKEVCIIIKESEIGG